MNCKDFEHNIINYLEKNLSETQNNNFLKHYNKCDKCKKKLKYFKKSFEIIENQKKTEVNPFIETRILSEINATKKENTIFKKILRPVFIASFMFLALFLGNFIAEKYINYKVQSVNITKNNNIDKSVQFAINDITYEDYYFINSQ